jgi:hypothetical protein
VDSVGLFGEVFEADYRILATVLGILAILVARHLLRRS